MTEHPAYLRGAEHKIATALVSLWVWATILEQQQLPTTATFLVYQKHLDMGGPQQLNGKRFRVTISVEDEQARPWESEAVE